MIQPALGSLGRLAVLHGDFLSHSSGNGDKQVDTSLELGRKLKAKVVRGTETKKSLDDKKTDA